MKNRFMALLVLTMILLMVGCQDELDGFSLILVNEDETIYETYEDLTEGQMSLPRLEAEDQFFLGWSNGETLYNDSIMIDKDMTLSAVFESYEDVFEVTLNPNTGQWMLDLYSGQLSYLKIPEKVSGRTIESIGTRFLVQSQVIEVDIPSTVKYIDEYAFEDATYLKSVSFYGTKSGNYFTRMQEDALEDFLKENSNGCTINDLDGFNQETTAKDQCAVILDYSKFSVWVDGEEIDYYDIMIDVSLAPQYGELMVGLHSFSGAPALEEIHFPSWVSNLYGLDFEGSNNISTITIPTESFRYRVIDNVIYSEDRTELIYYPNGLEETEFRIPSLTEKVMPYAFAHNDVLETITILGNVEELTGAFIDMKALTHFEVSEYNEKYASRDGLLFSRPNFFLDEYRLEAYAGGLTEKSFTLSDDIIEIGDYAFAYNEHLENLDLSDYIREIGNYAFFASKHIELLDIPESIRLIEKDICKESNVLIVIVRRLVEEVSYNNIRPVLTFTYLNSNVDNHPILYVPDEALSDYQDMLEGRLVLDYLKPLSEYEE